MAVLHGRDLLSSKYVTAIITDKTGRVFFVPIKNTIDDFFLAELNNQLYLFRLDVPKQYREKLTKQFQILFYDTTHYRPIDSHIKEIELFLEENSLPRVNGMMSDVLRILGNREKPGNFKKHKLSKLIKEIENYEKSALGKIIPQDKNQFQQQAKSIVNFLNELSIKEIVTPVRSISQFIEDDLKATDPKFPATVIQTLTTLDYENKRVTNSPVHASKPWLIPVLLVGMVAAVGIFAFWAYEQGVFDSVLSIGNTFGTIGDGITGLDPSLGQRANDPCSDAALQKKYPEPIQLKIAIENGQETCELSPFMQDIIDGVELPKVTPNP